MHLHSQQFFFLVCLLHLAVTTVLLLVSQSFSSSDHVHDTEIMFGLVMTNNIKLLRLGDAELVWLDMTQAASVDSWN